MASVQIIICFIQIKAIGLFEPCFILFQNFKAEYLKSILCRFNSSNQLRFFNFPPPKIRV